MITFIFVLLAVNCVLILIAYSLAVMAHDADERADRMYRKWKESIQLEDKRSNNVDIDG